MSWLETFRTGLNGVRSHRLRSALTVLGMLIGIAAVILTVGLGEGAQAQVASEITSLGTNILTISPGSSTSATGIRGGFGTASSLTTADVTALESPTVAPDIKAVAPMTSTSEALTAGTANWTTTVVGSTPSWLTVRDRTVAQGRFLDAQEIADHAAVHAVLAPTTAAGKLFSRGDPVGQTVDIAGVPMTVVGVLTATGASSSSSSTEDQDDQAIVPISTAAERLIGGTSRNTVSSIVIQARNAAALPAAYQEADNELSALHGITSVADADFTITSEQSLLSTQTSVDRTLTILLGGVAGISLLVGGIGVMNIMLVSVTERIREIGLRKALGATPGLIRRQFLVEASVLGLLGGALGALLGIVLAIFLPGWIGDPISISAPYTVLAIVVALGIGVSSSGSTRPAAPRTWPPLTRCAVSRSPEFEMHTKEREMSRLIHPRIGGGRRPVAALAVAATLALTAGVAGAASPTPQFGNASGSVAALNGAGSTMEVQNSTGQTTVTWTGTTAFTQIAVKTLTAVTTSDCLTVTGTASKKSKTTIAARSITITPVPTSGSCTTNGRGTTTGGGAPRGGGGIAGGGFRTGTSGGGSSSGGSGGPRTFPAQAAWPMWPSPRARSPQSVVRTSPSPACCSAACLRVRPRRNPAPSRPRRRSRLSPSLRSFKVTTSKTTTLSETVSTSAATLANGDCVTALGPASSTGAVAATRVTITSTGGGDLHHDRLRWWPASAAAADSVVTPPGVPKAARSKRHWWRPQPRSSPHRSRPWSSSPCWAAGPLPGRPPAVATPATAWPRW